VRALESGETGAVKAGSGGALLSGMGEGQEGGNKRLLAVVNGLQSIDGQGG
jgi:hypothetical protein